MTRYICTSSVAKHVRTCPWVKLSGEHTTNSIWLDHQLPNIWEILYVNINMAADSNEQLNRADMQDCANKHWLTMLRLKAFFNSHACLATAGPLTSMTSWQSKQSRSLALYNNDIQCFPSVVPLSRPLNVGAGSQCSSVPPDVWHPGNDVALESSPCQRPSNLPNSQMASYVAHAWLSAYKTLKVRRLQGECINVIYDIRQAHEKKMRPLNI